MALGSLDRPIGLRITGLTKTEGGYYTAFAHLNGCHALVDNRYGSWQIVRANAGDGSETRSHVLPAIAAALQAALPREDRKRR